MITCALIGIGYWGTKIVGYLQENKDIDLKYAVNSKFDKEIIWKDKDIEAVVIATPIKIHYQIAKDALLSNKHILVEKPITLHLEEAEELKQLATEKKRIIIVDYVYTFSKSINNIIKDIERIEKIKYIEMVIKQLGKFSDYDVYWLLASHMLSVLDMFIDLDKLKFYRQDHMKNFKLTTTGSIFFKGDALQGQIDVSLNYPEKEVYLNIYGDRGTVIYNPMSNAPVRYKVYEKKFAALPSQLVVEDFQSYLDEGHNLKLAIQYFIDAIQGKVESNVDRAIKITSILEKLGCQYKKL